MRRPRVHRCGRICPAPQLRRTCFVARELPPRATSPDAIVLHVSAQALCLRRNGPPLGQPTQSHLETCVRHTRTWRPYRSSMASRFPLPTIAPPVLYVVSALMS